MFNGTVMGIQDIHVSGQFPGAAGCQSEGRFFGILFQVMIVVLAKKA
jgi:hypothetical protein